MWLPSGHNSRMRWFAIAFLAVYGMAVGHEPLMGLAHVVADAVGVHHHESEDTHVDHDCDLCLTATSLAVNAPGDTPFYGSLFAGDMAKFSADRPYIADLPGVPSRRGPPASLLS